MANNDYMFSFGHGYSKQGSYDTGCVHVGNGVTFTEQEMVRLLKPYIKSWADKAGINVEFYTNNMFADRSIKSFKGYNVTEIHLDAPKGNGGHVIIHNGLNPDAQDKRIAAWIKNTFETVTYVGASGINKRDNLYNVNQAKTYGINYRLLELFFLSNDVDRNYYLNNLDAVAKGLLEAVTGKTLGGSVVKTPAATVNKVVAKGTVVAEDIPKPVANAKLIVDGYWGSLTTVQLQKVLGTAVDGVLSGQERNAITENIQGVIYGSGGSLAVKALQKLIGVTVDGYLGADTFKALQTFLGTVVDGKLSSPSLAVKALQTQLLAGKLVSKTVKVAAVKKVVAKTVKATSNGNKITVDGYIGKNTIEALQRQLGTPVDGILSSPSLVVKAMQKAMGLKVDGYWGKNTIKALQKRYGTVVDGTISNPSLVVRYMQTALNSGKF